MKICPKCGRRYEDNMSFCKQDGTPLVVEKPAEAPSEIDIPAITKICPKCGKGYEGHLKFCKVDGTPLVDNNTADEISDTSDKPKVEQAPICIMICPRCGRKYDAEQRFCQEDGTPLEEGSDNNAVFRDEVKPNDSRQLRLKTISVIAAALALLCIGAFILNRLGILPFGQIKHVKNQITDVDDSSTEAQVESSKESNRDERDELIGDIEESDDSEAADDDDVPRITDEFMEKIENDLWVDGLIEAGKKQEGGYNTFSLCDLDMDDIPELIMHGKDDPTSLRIVWWNGTEAEDMIDISDGVTLSVPEKRMLLWNSTDHNVICDKCFQIEEDGQLTTVFDGSCKLDDKHPFDKNGTPNLECYIDGLNVSEENYNENLGKVCPFDKAISLNTLARIDSSDVGRYLNAEWKQSFEKLPEEEKDSTVTYDYNDDVQFFVAPYRGEYRFTLYGAGGGTDNFRSYDQEGGAASLTGTMNLYPGQRVVILTGGRGDSAVSKEGVVKGGFNGGGDAYWSGGGGGCTDIWLEGIRVAAAAGGGGGNYDQVGRVGRSTDDANGNVTKNKNGGGNGNKDAGGGGGGWFGGSAGEKDQAGYGGVNGWNDKYFEMEKELSGVAYKETGSFDGSVIVKYVGD